MTGIPEIIAAAQRLQKAAPEQLRFVLSYAEYLLKQSDKEKAEPKRPALGIVKGGAS